VSTAANLIVAQLLFGASLLGQSYTICPDGQHRSISTNGYEKAVAVKHAYPAIIGIT